MLQADSVIVSYNNRICTRSDCIIYDWFKFQIKLCKIANQKIGIPLVEVQRRQVDFQCRFAHHCAARSRFGRAAVNALDSNRHRWDRK